MYLYSCLRWDASGEAEMDEALVQMSDIPKLSRVLQQNVLTAYSHEKEEVPQRPPPGHGNGSAGVLWGCTEFWGVSLAFTPSLHTKTNGSGKPSEFYSEAFEIVQHCQKKGFADSHNPIGKPRWIYDLGWKPIWTIILHESDPSPEPGKTSWFWLIFHTRLSSTSVLIRTEDKTVGTWFCVSQNLTLSQVGTTLFPAA